MSDHLPRLWKFRLLRAIHAKGVSENRRLLDAWQRAEGGEAKYNPLNTTEPWAGATNYNSVGVKNYPTAGAGINATARTLGNGFYSGIVRDLQAGKKPALRIVADNAHEFDTWGTGSANVARLLT